MAHLITSDDEYRDLTYDDAYRSYLITRTEPPYDYRFGRTQGKRMRVRARTALGRVNGFLKSMMASIVSSKLACIKRGLELRGNRFDRSGNGGTARNPQSTEYSR